MGKWTWILASLAALIALAFALRDDPPRQSSAPSGDAQPAKEATPGLQAARGPLARPAVLHLHVRTLGGGAPPPSTIVGLITPPGLRAEREGTLDRSFTGRDFEGERLVIPDLRHRAWDLLVCAPGHRGLRRQFTLPADPASTPHVIEVDLEAWASLDVRVFDAEGAPLEGATLRLAGADPRLGSPPIHPEDRPILEILEAATTDRDGRWELAALLPGVEATVRVEHPDHPRAARTLRTPPPGARDALAITLAAPSGIRGSVDLAAFAAPAEALILSDFHHVEGGASLERRSPIEADGRFFLRNVLPGLHTVQVTARGVGHAACALRVVEVAVGETVDLGRIGPDAGAPLRVTVHVEEPFARGARIRAHLTVFPAAEAARPPLDRLEYEFALPVGREHELRGLPPGAVSCAFLLVDPRGALLASHRDGKAAVPADDARTEVLEVVLRRRPKPRPPAYLRVRATPPAGVARADLRWRVFVFDEAGRLEGAMPRGIDAASLRLAMPPRDTPLRLVAVAHGRVARPVDLDAVPAAGAEVRFATWPQAASTVDVLVEDRRGRPVRDATVHARLGADVPAARAISVRTDAGGRASLDTLPGHDLFLYVEGDARSDPEPVVLRAAQLGVGERTSCTLILERAP